MTFDDTHLHRNPLTNEIVCEQLRRKPRPLPTLRFARTPMALGLYRQEGTALSDYRPYPVIRAPISV